MRQRFPLSCVRYIKILLSIPQFFNQLPAVRKRRRPAEMAVKTRTRTESDRSEDEKVVGPMESVQFVEELPDPDAHLSAAERAAIVSCSAFRQ